eukprot:PhF_6_TR27782/c0_g1_i1/m.40465
MFQRQLIRFRPKQTVPALPVSHLPNIPYTLPNKKSYGPESCGAFHKEWLRHLPGLRQFAENARYLPSAEKFWAMNGADATRTMLQHMSYVTQIHSANTMSLDLSTLISAPDAPTPDIIYDDIMRLKTFQSHQLPAEEQYLLEDTVLIRLLSMAASCVLLDPDYYRRADIFFRKVERQQNLSAEAYSCWALICIGAGKVDAAFAVLEFMDKSNMTFSVDVFVLCMNPGSKDFRQRFRPDHARSGIVAQRRLHNRLTSEHTASTVGLHAFFVCLNLMLNHVQKWEVIRTAVTKGIFFAPRTISYVVEMLKLEGARRCGPLTVNSLIVLFCQAGEINGLESLLSRVRQNEMIEEHREYMSECIVIGKAVTDMVKKKLHMAVEAREIEVPRVERIVGLMENNAEVIRNTLEKQPLKPLYLPIPAKGEGKRRGVEEETRNRTPQHMLREITENKTTQQALVPEVINTLQKVTPSPKKLRRKTNKKKWAHPSQLQSEKRKEALTKVPVKPSKSPFEEDDLRTTVEDNVKKGTSSVEEDNMYLADQLLENLDQNATKESEQRRRLSHAW